MPSATIWVEAIPAAKFHETTCYCRLPFLVLIPTCHPSKVAPWCLEKARQHREVASTDHRRRVVMMGMEETFDLFLLISFVLVATSLPSSFHRNEGMAPRISMLFSRFPCHLLVAETQRNLLQIKYSTCEVRTLERAHPLSWPHSV